MKMTKNVVSDDRRPVTTSRTRSAGTLGPIADGDEIAASLVVHDELLATPQRRRVVLRCTPCGSESGRSLHGGWQKLSRARCTAVAGAVAATAS
jgi:hypothetical protein